MRDRPPPGRPPPAGGPARESAPAGQVADRPPVGPAAAGRRPPTGPPTRPPIGPPTGPQPTGEIPVTAVQPTIRQPAGPPVARAPDRRLVGGVDRLRGARSELRRQLQEQRRLRATAMATVVLLVLGAPLLYFGVLFATRDPVLNSLDRLRVPSWAAQTPQDRIISGSRWCFIDCRFRERTLVSEEETGQTTEVYQSALREAGWLRWEVEGCPQVAVDGDYSCWTRDEYTLDLWVRQPDCAYDPLNLRPDPEAEEEAEAEGSEAPASEPPGGEGADECTGSVVQIKMQNRVADERGLSGPGSGPGPAENPPEPTGTPPTGPPSPDPDAD
ncbi:MAG: hypothetical protein GEV12_03665 [Micromonosporaceae bacterium]|nr:hypothetical protein [Micromonosporaceae bacterium]